MISQKGFGSLYSVLRERNLCNNLNVDTTIISGFGFFFILCDITNDGLERVDEILTLVFQVKGKLLKYQLQTQIHPPPRFQKIISLHFSNSSCIMFRICSRLPMSLTKTFDE